MGETLVFTRDDLYALDWGGPTSEIEFTPRAIPIGQGLSAPKGFCVSPSGVFFIYKDGIYQTDCNSESICVTKDSLKPIFLGRSSSEFLPIDWSKAYDIVLESVGQEIHFLDHDTSGQRMHLVYDILQARWQRFFVPDVNSPALVGLYDSTLTGLQGFWEPSGSHAFIGEMG